MVVCKVGKGVRNGRTVAVGKGRGWGMQGGTQRGKGNGWHKKAAPRRNKVCVMRGNWYQHPVPKGVVPYNIRGPNGEEGVGYNLP